MEVRDVCETAARPMMEYCLAPLGLSEDDCGHVTAFVRSIAPDWNTEIQEDAFGQRGLVMARCRTNRLQWSLIAYRINESWFLDEVSEATIHEVGEFTAVDGLLRALRCRLVDDMAIPRS